MVDPSIPENAPVAPVCPWCSAPLSTTDPDTCPSCGAALRLEGEQQLPGLTAIDPQAIIRAKSPPKKRSRLLSWLSGESDDDLIRPGDAKAVAFPDLDVRREMLRLEIAADLANLQAEADSILSDAAADGRVLNIPPDVAEAAGLTPVAADGEGADLPSADAAAGAASTGAAPPTDAPEADRPA
jgi:hypothetical protein